ncbi:MAG: O-antigen ligase [Xanthobacteraceae bacterium]
MTVAPSATRESLARHFPRGEHLLRSTLFLATFLAVWVTASPFPDPSDPVTLEATNNGNLRGQIIAILLTSALALFAVVNKLRVLRRVVTPILVLIFVWFACTALLSAYPGLAVRRLVLAGFVIFQAAMLVFLPEDRLHFARLLALGAVLILILCWGGVLVAPHLSIHQSTDLAEPQLAGNWRGLFAHKNGAGECMGLLIIFGIYIARRLNAVLGAGIVVFAGLFLFFTDSKSPMMLLPLALMFGVLFVWVRKPVAKLIVLLSVPLIIGALTIGSVEVPALNTLVGQMPDPTFTGRSVIWQFALDHIAERPIVGFGYEAFWQTEELVSSWTWLESWGFRASDAHNGFLNIAVTTGLVGLVLALGWLLVRPFIDHVRTSPGSVDSALNLMFIQIWLFGIYLCGFESELFRNGSALWFMMAVSIIALRVQATADHGTEAR